MEQFLTTGDTKIFNAMYEGDKNRDASSTIRGYMFQNLVMLNYLAENNVECACLEGIEDVDIKYSDNSLWYIQAKYYPGSSLKIEEIMCDLYYQYLRFKICNSTVKAVPVLVYNRKTKKDLEVPKIKEIKKYVSSCVKGSFTIPDEHPTSPVDAVEWLKDNVNNNNKIEQEQILFKNFASEATINEFISAVKLVKTNLIEDYRKEVINKLKVAVGNVDCSAFSPTFTLEEILLGIALDKVQERYLISDPTIDKIMVSKIDFFDDIKSTFSTATDDIIVAYLISKIYETHEFILENNDDLEDILVEKLDKIANSTIIWIKELSKSDNWKYKLLNTISKKKEITQEQVDAYKIFHENAENFELFLDYSWKIILDINGKDEDYDESDLSISKYIDNTENRYIKFSFDDTYNSDMIILPVLNGPRYKSEIKAIFNRIKQMDIRPKKWGMYNDNHYVGKCYYETDIAHFNDSKSIVNMDENDAFMLECMECIKLDDKWNDLENCYDCLFNKECARNKY